MQPEDARGFFGSLFDFSFESFITSKIIRLLYILSVAGAGLMYLMMVIGGFQTSYAMGILCLLIIGPIMFLLVVIYARVVLEIIMVIFSIAENVKILSREAGTTSAQAPAKEIKQQQ